MARLEMNGCFISQATKQVAQANETHELYSVICWIISRVNETLSSLFSRACEARRKQELSQNIRPDYTKQMTLLVERASAMMDSIDHSMRILEARSIRIADEDANMNVAEQRTRRRLDQFRRRNSSRQQRHLQTVQSLMSDVLLNYRYIVENESVETIPHATTQVIMSPLRPDCVPEGVTATPATLPTTSGRKTRVRFGPSQTLYIGRCSVKKHILWWSKQELERMRNQSRTMLTDQEQQSLAEYLRAVEIECVRVMKPNETSPETTTPDLSQQQMVRGLALGLQGLERFAPLELLRQQHRRSTVRDIVALSLSWMRNPYRSDLIRAAYVQKAGPAVEWALRMGAASYLAATTAIAAGTVEEPPEDQKVVATWMRETRYQRIEV
jgi:hypothetical protein